MIAADRGGTGTRRPAPDIPRLLPIWIVAGSGKLTRFEADLDLPFGNALCLMPYGVVVTLDRYLIHRELDPLNGRIPVVVAGATVGTLPANLPKELDARLRPRIDVVIPGPAVESVVFSLFDMAQFAAWTRSVTDAGFTIRSSASLHESARQWANPISGPWFYTDGIIDGL